MQSYEKTFSKMCQIHPEEPVMGLCMKSDCASKNRLVCFQCLISDSIHSSHQKCIVALNQITQDGQCYSNWPQDEEGQAVRQLLHNLKKIKSHEDIDRIFSTFKKQLNSEIDKIQQDVKQVYDEQYAETSKFVVKLEKEYNNIYTLNRVLSLLSEYHNGNLNFEELHLNINSFLVSDEKKSSLQNLREIIKQEGSRNFLSFDQKLFDDCSKACLKSINSFGQSFKSASSFNCMQLEVAQVKTPSSATLTNEDSIIQFLQTAHSVVYSNKPIGTGMYNIKVRLDTHTSGCYVIGLEREANKTTSNYWGQGYPACCITCKAQDAILMATNTEGFFIGNHLSPGKIMNIEICLRKNIFNIGVEGTTVAYKLTENHQFLENEQWRLFFNNYSGQPCSFSLISSMYSEFV